MPRFPSRVPAVFEVLARAPGSLCALSGAPAATTAPVGLFGTRETSVLSADPFARLEIRRDRSARFFFRGGETEDFSHGDPGTTIDYAIGRFSLAHATGIGPGCALAIAYEAAPWFAPVRLKPREGERGSDVLLVASFYENVLTEDENGALRMRATGYARENAAAAEHARWLSAQLDQVSESTPPGPEAATLQSSMSKESYLEALAAVQEFIAAGDIYQVNLSQQLSMSAGDPAAIWRRLVEAHPTGWSTWLDMGEAGVLLSNSPECFLRRRGQTLETFPIKGTRASEGSDAAATIEELRRDPKELAEHRMIIDLERNDLGRIAQIGSVDVPAREYVESYGTVHHLVSCVRARVNERLSVGEILRATFPGGSITGAPKKRAMEIIDMLEPVGRGFYTGALGTISANGDMDLSIVIRAAHYRDGALHYSAGGGIVADSRAEAEVAESWLKALAFLRACGMEGSHD
ncbi:MAG: anthranilate synthase component I family protein [Chrysiogenetes bacterium]|nr:anthranilate synthase component I family protein [Chrysiogenetes bacterium]